MIEIVIHKRGVRLWTLLVNKDMEKDVVSNILNSNDEYLKGSSLIINKVKNNKKNNINNSVYRG